MNLNDIVTIVTPNWNNLYGLTLMWESFRRHHPGIWRWHVWDDCSEDDADKYAEYHATVFNRSKFPQEQNTCGALNLLIAQVETPYVMTVDGDVEFLGPVLESMMASLDKHVAIAPKRPTAGGQVIFGHTLRGTPRVEHYCTLWKTKEIQHWLKYLPLDHHFTFGYTPLKFDATGILYQAMLAAGYTFCHDDTFLWKNVMHYGGMSALWAKGLPEVVYQHLGRRYELIKDRLQRLRYNQQDGAGLTWTEWGWA